MYLIYLTYITFLLCKKLSVLSNQSNLSNLSYLPLIVSYLSNLSIEFNLSNLPVTYLSFYLSLLVGRSIALLVHPSVGLSVFWSLAVCLVGRSVGPVRCSHCTNML